MKPEPQPVAKEEEEEEDSGQAMENSHLSHPDDEPQNVSCASESIDLVEIDDDGIELMDDEDHPEDEHLLSLLSVVNKRRQGKLLEEEFADETKRSQKRSFSLVTLLQLSLLLGALLAVLSLLLGVSLLPGLDYLFRYPTYECPPSFLLPPDAPESKNYLLAQDRVYNETEFLATYRDDDYDHWGVSFKDFKKEMYGWKRRYFVPNIRSGDTIYESASGLGLNLVATLEILQEVKNITNVHVYGNDFLFESVYTSNNLMDQGMLPAKAKKGRICQGDSTNLHWVPSNAFDVVFTGYIPPLQDPLDFGLDEDGLWNKYKDICKASTGRKANLVAEMKQIQEGHYGQWVNEMIRIAKPGAPVIVEQVSMSVCSNLHDWGGVDLDFWFNAVEAHGWDINIDSIVMEEDTVGEADGRYHIFMRKNGS